MEDQIRRIKTAGMCFLRAFIGHRMMDHKNKGNIREKMGMRNIKAIINAIIIKMARTMGKTA
jgi:hypothetical protein